MCAIVYGADLLIKYEINMATSANCCLVRLNMVSNLKVGLLSWTVSLGMSSSRCWGSDGKKAKNVQMMGVHADRLRQSGVL